MDDHAILTMDGFDSAIVGIVERHGMEPVVLYDEEKVVRTLMRQGLSREDAQEYMDFNQKGAWVGSGTPAFLRRMTAAEVREFAEQYS